MLLNIILESKTDLNTLAKIINIYPQVLINAKVSNDKKYDFEKDGVIRAEIEQVEKSFQVMEEYL